MMQNRLSLCQILLPGNITEVGDAENFLLVDEAWFLQFNHRDVLLLQRLPPRTCGYPVHVHVYTLKTAQVQRAQHTCQQHTS